VTIGHAARISALHGVVDARFCVVMSALSAYSRARKRSGPERAVKAEGPVSEELIPIGEANIHEAESLKGRLRERDVTVELAVSPGDCSGGACGIKAQIWVRAADLPKVQEYFAEEHARRHAGLDFDPAVVGQVFDTSAEEATCPACATRFSTALAECPDCGLSFAVPAE
jgi:hypothetical protein